MADFVIWVFQGSGSPFPSAIFSSRENAYTWIENSMVSGVLTQYPVNQSVYDWAIQGGYFKPKDESKKTPAFIEKFSSAYLAHEHFEDGLLK